MLEFLGRFHPVFVHLPIGILLVACLFILLSFRTKFEGLKSAISIMLLLGALSAIISCITGYLLANNGDYDGDLVSTHQWMGISVAALSIGLYFIYSKVKSSFILRSIALLLIVLISATGHLGGSLTHGADYLTAPLKSGEANHKSAIPPIQNIQEAFVYQDAIQPLLKNRCYSCHGSEKQKGKLRLDKETLILKGGKNGAVIIPGKADQSELIKRILLPVTDEDHMAPKEKPQLTAHEVKLLKWWVENGADFKKKFKELPQSAEIKSVFVSLAKGENPDGQSKPNELPEQEVGMADEETLKKLTALGVSIAPITQNTNYLSANFINPKFNKTTLDLIPSIAKQLLWLKLEQKEVTDQMLQNFSKCKNLTKLNLNYSAISDAGLVYLKDFEALQSLSLVGTKISIKGIEQLQKLRQLKFLYLYQSKVNKVDLIKIKKLLPNVKIDTGNYKVPFMVQDTTVVKPPVKK
jgi:uncharacterized membrane protein